jgi:tRNA pseudouridine32 synthase/23S rRNA pseudouridine746 synthase
MPAKISVNKSPLPTREGISPSYIWIPENCAQELLNFLKEQFPDVSEAIWLRRIAKHEVRNIDGEILQANSRLKRGMCVYYYREIEEETPIPFYEQLLYQDAHLLVVDKPHFLPVTPGGKFLKESLLVRLKQKTGIDTLSPIHRLDRETAGVMLFSCDPSSRGSYQNLFQQKRIQKIYHAVAPHLPQLDFPITKASRLIESEQFFVMQETAGEANSETLITVLERRGTNDLYQLQPSTGKKHQLRVHLCSLGAPIINDTFYPDIQPWGADNFNKPLQLLAKSIAFTDPITSLERHFESLQKL